jgi:hypothetical protein
MEDTSGRFAERPTPASEIPIDKQSAASAAAARVARDRSIRRKVAEKLGGGDPGNPNHMADTERRAEVARDEAMRRFREGR